MTQPSEDSGPSPVDLPLEIDVLDLARWRDAGEPHLLVDVREPWEIEICALPDSRLLPMGQVPERLDELPRDQVLVVLCHHGMRSRQVTGWLRAQGFDKAVNLAGGIDAWARVVDRSVPVY